MAGKLSTARPAKMHIKAGDTVYVRAGKDREQRLSPEELDRLTPEDQQREADKRPGKRGRVLKVLPGRGRVIVEGVNMQTKHSRPRGRMTRAAQLQSGRIQQPGSIAVANAMLVCPNCDRPTRVRRGAVEDKVVRICRRCGESVDAIR